MKMFIKACVASLFLASAAAFAGPVNINTADAATLAAELDGVGQARAEAIVRYREEHGEFESLDDLRKVKGIGAAIIDKNAGNILFRAPGPAS